MEDFLIQNGGLNQGTTVQLVPPWKNLALKWEETVTKEWLMRIVTSGADSRVIQTTMKTLQCLVFLCLHSGEVEKDGNQSYRNDSYRQRWLWDYQYWIITKFVSLLNMPDMPYCSFKSLIKKVRTMPSFPLGFFSVPLGRWQKRTGCLKLPV